MLCKMAGIHKQDEVNAEQTKQIDRPQQHRHSGQACSGTGLRPDCASASAARSATDSGSFSASSGTIASGSTPPTTKIAGQPKTDTSWLYSTPPIVKPIGDARRHQHPGSRPWAIGGAKSESERDRKRDAATETQILSVNGATANCKGRASKACEQREDAEHRHTANHNVGLRPKPIP